VRQLCILVNIARDVLVIPASTVASESTFNTSERVVSDYRTRVHPKWWKRLLAHKTI